MLICCIYLFLYSALVSPGFFSIPFTSISFVSFLLSIPVRSLSSFKTFSLSSFTNSSSSFNPCSLPRSTSTCFSNFGCSSFFASPTFILAFTSVCNFALLSAALFFPSSDNCGFGFGFMDSCLSFACLSRNLSSSCSLCCSICFVINSCAFFSFSFLFISLVLNIFAVVASFLSFAFSFNTLILSSRSSSSFFSNARCSVNFCSRVSSSLFLSSSCFLFSFLFSSSCILIYFLSSS